MAMSEALSNQEVQAAWAKLSEDARTGVLLTLRVERPFGSHGPYVFGKDWTHACIHVSRLALHTADATTPLTLVHQRPSTKGGMRET